MIGDIEITVHPVANDPHTIAVAVSVKHWTLGGWLDHAQKSGNAQTPAQT